MYYPLHRYEFAPPKFFFKTFKFSMIFCSTWQISGGGQFRKACRPGKKESKQSEITWKQSEPLRSISKIEKRREFVRALWYEQCTKNSFKRLYTVKGLLVLFEKASFSKEFRCKFHSGGEGNIYIYEYIWIHMCICKCIYIHSCINICIHIYVYIYTYKCICIYKYIFILRMYGAIWLFHKCADFYAWCGACVTWHSSLWLDAALIVTRRPCLCVCVCVCVCLCVCVYNNITYSHGI